MTGRDCAARRQNVGNGRCNTHRQQQEERARGPIHGSAGRGSTDRKHGDSAQGDRTRHRQQQGPGRGGDAIMMSWGCALRRADRQWCPKRAGIGDGGREGGGAREGGRGGDDEVASATGAWGKARSISARARPVLAPPSTAVYSVSLPNPNLAHLTRRRQLSDSAFTYSQFYLSTSEFHPSRSNITPPPPLVPEKGEGFRRHEPVESGPAFTLSVSR